MDRQTGENDREKHRTEEQTRVKTPDKGPRKYQVGDLVWLQAQNKRWNFPGTIAAVREKGKSYWIDAESGSCLLRNKRFIKRRLEESRTQRIPTPVPDIDQSAEPTPAGIRRSPRLAARANRVKFRTTVLLRYFKSNNKIDTRHSHDVQKLSSAHAEQ